MWHMYNLLCNIIVLERSKYNVLNVLGEMGSLDTSHSVASGLFCKKEFYKESVGQGICHNFLIVLKFMTRPFSMFKEKLKCVCLL